MPLRGVIVLLTIASVFHYALETLTFTLSLWIVRAPGTGIAEPEETVILHAA